jgi:hypothetical protein
LAVMARGPVTATTFDWEIVDETDNFMGNFL